MAADVMLALCVPQADAALAGIGLPTFTDWGTYASTEAEFTDKLNELKKFKDEVELNPETDFDVFWAAEPGWTEEDQDDEVWSDLDYDGGD